MLCALTQDGAFTIAPRACFGKGISLCVVMDYNFLLMFCILLLLFPDSPNIQQPCANDENIDRVTEEEYHAPNATEANNEIAVLQSLAQNTQGQLVYALDEYGNQIALGVILSEDFHNHTEISESNEEITVSEDNQCNWIAAEEECPSNCNTMDSTDIKEEPFVPLSTPERYEEPLNMPKKCAKDVIKLYKIDHAARKTLKKIKASKNSRKKVIPSKGKKCEKYKVQSVQGLYKRKKTNRKQCDKTFAMPNSLRGIKFAGIFTKCFKYYALNVKQVNAQYVIYCSIVLNFRET